MSDAELTRRTFLAGASAALSGAALARQDDGPRLTHGPFSCACAPERIGFWARANQYGAYLLELEAPTLGPENSLDEGRSTRSFSTATSDNDHVLRWMLPPLRTSASSVTVRISRAGQALHEAQIPTRLATGIPNGRAVQRSGEVRLAIGSCADERRFPDQPVWDRMRERKPDLVALIGDTPYIDSTELEVQRARYRAFYSQPQLAALLRETPFVGTWDDHDFAANDQFGAIAGREDSRRAFLEYHGPGEWGRDGQGVFTKRNVGPIELYLLDTRWFADTERSPFDASKKTLLGVAQWRWLQQELLASSAPIKLLACGMVWNDAVRPGKADFWGRWPHERAALFEWLGRKRIEGVVLVSGDVHRTRVIEHATKDVVGYDLLELVTSPIANTVIESNGVELPGLLFDRGVEQSFLLVSASPEKGTIMMRAVMIDGAGETMFSLERGSSELRRDG